MFRGTTIGQGKLARRTFRLPGDDIDAAGAPFGHRIGIIDDTEDKLIASIRRRAHLHRATIGARIATGRQWLQDRTMARQRRTNVLTARIAAAAAWRQTGIQERYTTTELGRGARALIFLVLGGLDFYVFAQAYAFVDDVPDFSVQWWLGGLLGLTVFGAGLTLGRQLKTLVVSRRQAVFRRERPVAADLVELDVSRPVVVASAVFFLLLCAAGLVVRMEGSSDQELGVLLLQAMIPLLVVVVETYLFDPLHRYEPGENVIDRFIRAWLTALQNRHDRMVTVEEHDVASVRAAMESERRIARIIAADKGMRLDAPPVAPAPSTGNGVVLVEPLGNGLR